MMSDVEDETQIDGVKFNLTKFLKGKVHTCESFEQVWEAKKTLRSQKSQITRGITELETIFKDLQKAKNSPPLDSLLVHKWRDVFISKRNSLNTKLLSLGNHLRACNAALSDMAGSMAVGEEFSKYEERFRVDVVEEYNTYSTNF